MPKRRPQNPPQRLIALEGPIGVGKTELARFLARRLSARLVLEEVENNPFLRTFYSDPARNAFQTQTFFLLSRYQQQLDLRQEDLFLQTTICDYIFQKDRIFAYLTLSEPELALYEQIYRLLDPRVPTPDLVVYLQARVDVLGERIRARNRPWERAIRPGYLEKLVASYNDFFLHYRASPLLVINTSELDFNDRDTHLEGVLSAIRRMRGGVQYFNPS